MGMFSTPSMPKMPDPPAPPPTRVDEGVLARRESARARRRSGRQDTLLTGPGGLVSRGSIAVPTLLGRSSTPMGGGV